MIEVNLIQGNGQDIPERNDGAFDLDKMRKAGVSADVLLTELARAVSPFAGLLKDGHGVAVTLEGDDGGVIGIKL